MTPPRTFKIVRHGMTTNCPTHSLEEVAEELVESWRGYGMDDFEVRTARGRPVSERDQQRIVEAARDMIANQ